MRKTRKSSLKEKISRFQGYIFIIFSVILIVSVIRNISRIRRSENKIDEARERVVNLEQKKAELEDKLKQAESDIYLETQLRDGLGLAREEEIVIVLPDDQILRRIAPDIEERQDTVGQEPIWKKWLKLFTSLE